MFHIFLKSAIRNLLKNKLHSAINLTGLAVGLAAVICIAIYLQNELSYDRFHAHGGQLFRIGIESYREGALLGEGHVFVPPIGPAMRDELAGVKNYTRYRTPREAYFSTSGKSLKTGDVIHADSSFFQLFSFPLLSGDPATALSAPYSLVLTESTAERLFGTARAVGKTVKMNEGSELKITAIAADPPANSQLQFQAVVSFSTLYHEPGNYMDWNGGEQYVTYIELGKNVRPADVEAQFPDFLWRKINKEYAAYNLRLEAHLQPLPDLHLWHNAYSSSLRTNLFAMGGMALLMLLIACFNFINITTARAGRRAGEVGVRKVLGATRFSLGGQFLGEAFLLTGMAVLLALILAEIALPVLPRLFGKALEIPGLFQWATAGGLLLLLLVVGIGAGAYPSFLLASFDPVKTLKGRRSGSGSPGFRNGLVVFQFTASTALIVSTLIISQQLDFTQKKALGFDRENVLVLPLTGAEMQSKTPALKQKLKQSPRIVGAAACSETPGEGFTQNGYRPEGIEEPMLFHVVDVDDDFLPLFGLELTAGKALSRDRPADRQAFLINETLARQMDWVQPIGKTISRDGEHEVVGTVRDFHFASLHRPIEPLIITCSPWEDRFDFLTVKLAPGHLDEGIAAVREAWEGVLPGTPLDFWFLDDAIGQIYESERRLQEAFFWCSGLSIFIALMGIFGLTAFSVEQRKKEIGIRKVLGASTAGIVGLFAKNFLKLVFIALVIASPPAYFFMEKWLSGFAYHIEIQWWVFASAGILVTVVAFFTVGHQSVKAALANPVDSLRSE